VRTHASGPDVERRVTLDRAVWTKPLACAADAALPLWALNREDHRRAGVPDRHGIAKGAWGRPPTQATARLAVCDVRGRRHLRPSRVRPRHIAGGEPAMVPTSS
jgi:hypothetical protein